MTEPGAATVSQQDNRIGWLQILILVLIAMAVTVAVTLWLVKSYFFTSEFTPVSLSSREQQTLTHKLERLEEEDTPGAADTADLQPERYSEAGASREVSFSERELNGLLANNTDLARRVAVDLSEDLISAKILVPMDEDFPILGGKTLRARTGVEFAYENGRPIVKLKGVSIMGVPVPNAWLGGLKNIDLVNEFGNEEGFWKAFAEGIDAVNVKEGSLRIRLKE